jgi:plastocyanin
MRRRIVLLSLLGMLVAGLVTGLVSASTKAMAPRRITVNMSDFRFAFAPRPPLKHGVPYLFRTVNKGQAPHNFDIQGIKAGKIITPGKVSSFRVTFKKAGRYPYVCDVPRHAELGMRGLLVVR